jgi:prevent-host-death family protein
VPWQLQEAKQKFSQVVQRAIDEGPQVVTRHGETVAVVVSIDEYRRLTGGKLDFTEFLLSAPDLSVLDLKRAMDRPRELDL